MSSPIVIQSAGASSDSTLKWVIIGGAVIGAAVLAYFLFVDRVDWTKSAPLTLAIDNMSAENLWDNNPAYAPAVLIDTQKNTFGAYKPATGKVTIDLKSMHNIDKVVITNRQDCCQERLKTAIVTVLDESKNFIKSVVIGKSDDVVEVELRVKGRYITLHNPSSELNFAEIVVHGIKA